MYAHHPQVYCIGESVLDIIFIHGQPVHATPGGSVLNSAVSLGRCGVHVHLISDYGQDQPGRLIDDYLHANGVSTRHVNRYADGRTALALAFLDENQNATYTFYKANPANRLSGLLPEAGAGDIILFGSIYSISEDVHGTILSFVRQAKKRGALILYDPNFRASHLPELESARPRIIENMGEADLVKGSDEDFRLIFGAADFKSALEVVRNAGCSSLICTRNKFPVEAWVNEEKLICSVPEIRVKSSIGAGDAFSAGLICALNESPGILCENPMKLIETGIRFSAEVCQQMDNTISPEFAAQFKKS